MTRPGCPGPKDLPYLGLDLSLQKDLKDAVKVRIDLVYSHFRRQALNLNTIGTRGARIVALVLVGETFVKLDGRVSEETKQIAPSLLTVHRE